MRDDSSSSVLGKLRMRRFGIRYSNIVALHERRTGAPCTVVTDRPR